MEKSLLVNDSLTGSCIAVAQSLVLVLSAEVLLRLHLDPIFIVSVGLLKWQRVSAFSFWLSGLKHIAPELVPLLLSAGS